MKTLEEIRSDSRLMMKKDGLLPEGCYSARIKLSNGVEGSVVFGLHENGIWEHISIELFRRRLPTWEEMCEVKDIFWNEDEECVQIHPRIEDYVNITEALHIWRPCDGDWSHLNEERR